MALVNTTTGSQQLVINIQDLFLRFGKFLNETDGFSKFDEFYRVSKDFKLELTTGLLKYYQYLSLNIVDKIKESLNEIVFAVCEYQIFIKDLHTNEEFSQEFNDYFTTKKSNITELDPNENGDLIISKIQAEWILRIQNLDNYYQYIFELNCKQIEKKANPTSFIDKAIELFSWNSNKKHKLMKAIAAPPQQSNLDTQVKPDIPAICSVGQPTEPLIPMPEPIAELEPEPVAELEPMLDDYSANVSKQHGLYTII